MPCSMSAAEKSRELTGLLHMVQAKSAEVGFGLAYRTVQYPQMEDCAGSGKAKDHQIGERYHVTYLNAAGREVCHARSMLLQRAACSCSAYMSRSTAMPLTFLRLLRRGDMRKHCHVC